HHKKEIKEATPPDVSEMLEKFKPNNVRKSKASHGILVEGEAGMLVRLARCCNPIPGDPITGYITKGRGVSVHRADCPNVLADNGDTTRVIEVNWDVGLDKNYNVEIEISCADRPAMLTSILAVPVEMKLNVTSVNAKTNKNDKTSIVVMGLDVRTASQVSMIMTKIRRLKDVYSVSRAMATTVDNNSNGR
ncbi:MAG: ACT domain-containing protein, partial [Anaerovibrio sp.]|nr:ACT domain-containing protein [Anaerovibrio sp.]